MFRSLAASVGRAFEINSSTLSGCLDVIVVQQTNGDFKSTPFHVRFGKTKILKSREKVVTITVNGELSPVTLVLGSSGEAYFPLDVESGEVPPRGILFSPDETQVPIIDIEQDNEEELQSGTPKNVSIAALRERVEFSLCGHSLYGSADNSKTDTDIFECNVVGWDVFDSDPSLWYHKSLVVRFDKSLPLYPGKVALPLIASLMVFGKPLSLKAFQDLLESDLSLVHPDYSSLNKADNAPKSIAASTQAREEIPAPSMPGCESCDSQPIWTLWPSTEQLKRLNLKPGANPVTFSVSSSLQGTRTLRGTIYLWSASSKIVISDVDGTITKSDVLGQLMPIVGRDWTHTGVANLFSMVGERGYKIIYLSARAIGQADSTRDYLFRVTESETQNKLPDGPLILSPDRLFPSFHREVIERRPYVFKIDALRDIRHLFPTDVNPFYAGFGNRDTDHRSYVHIGVPEAKIFIVDPKGTLHHLNKTYAKTYESMCSIADDMFPYVSDSSSTLSLQCSEQVRRHKILPRSTTKDGDRGEAPTSPVTPWDGFINFQCCGGPTSSRFPNEELRIDASL
eukprot:GHVP01028656.1.p1 GENE.GHVP01028656.1~~GHVP01028656.1.p1  ORF type:complete len:568 (-),score=74.78 GHVP01028656.1:3986-5689(-)